jgi:predicted phage tail protein
MLGIIRNARFQALNHARVDMPGGKINPGVCRQIVPVPLPEKIPALSAETDVDGLVRLSWERSANAIGLSFDVYRGDRIDFEPAKAMLLATTTMFSFEDANSPAGQQYYALVAASKNERSRPVYAAVDVPASVPPAAPTNVKAVSQPGQVKLTWEAPLESGAKFNVYRSDVAGSAPRKLNSQPILGHEFVDVGLPGDVDYTYVVRSVDRRGRESRDGPRLSARALPERKEPVLIAALTENLNANFLENDVLKGTVRGPAAIRDGSLELRGNAYVTYP